MFIEQLVLHVAQDKYSDEKGFKERYLKAISKSWFQNKHLALSIWLDSRQGNSLTRLNNDRAHDWDHLESVACNYALACTEVPDVYQMNDHDFGLVLNGGLLAAWLHDKQQMQSGTKLAHAEIAAYESYVALIDKGADPELALTTASCIYYHPWERIQELEKNFFQLPPMEVIFEQILQKCEAHGISIDEIWGDGKIIRQKVEENRDKYRYPVVSGAVIEQAVCRFALADEMDSWKPSLKSIFRIMSRPNRPFMTQINDSSDILEEIEKRIANGNQDESFDDVSRFLAEQDRVNHLKTIFRAKAFEKEEILEAVDERYTAFLKIAECLAFGDETYIRDEYDSVKTLVIQLMTKTGIEDELILRHLEKLDEERDRVLEMLKNEAKVISPQQLDYIYWLIDNARDLQKTKSEGDLTSNRIRRNPLRGLSSLF